MIVIIPFSFARCTMPTHRNRSVRSSLKVTSHLTTSMCGQRATGKIQRNDYHHGHCWSALTGKKSSVGFDFYASECQKSLSEK